jgi:hypothetical protein
MIGAFKNEGGEVKVEEVASPSPAFLSCKKRAPEEEPELHDEDKPTQGKRSKHFKLRDLVPSLRNGSGENPVGDGVNGSKAMYSPDIATSRFNERVGCHQGNRPPCTRRKRPPSREKCSPPSF